jgi:hypothetical protein
MKPVLATFATAALLALSACGDGSGSTGPSVSGGAIDAALLGSWARPGGTMFMDTLVFSSTGHYYVTSCSGSGAGLKATGGQVWCPASQKVCGEYELVADTLWYEDLLGSTANGVVPHGATNRFVKVK